MKHLLFFLIFIIIANNNLHAYPNKNENIYNYKFSVLELFFKKYYPPAGDSSSIIVDHEKLFNKLNINRKPLFFMIYYCKKLI